MKKVFALSVLFFSWSWLVAGPVPFSFFKDSTPPGFSIGLDTVAANSDAWGADAAVTYRVQASASGTLQNGFVYVNDTAASVTKIAIYGPDTDGVPNSEDLLIGVSSPITGGGTAGWYSSAMSGGAVTSGQYYWVVIFVSSSSPTLSVRTENATSVSYKASGGNYASPPADLAGYGASSGTYGRISAYVSAQ